MVIRICMINHNHPSSIGQKCSLYDHTRIFRNPAVKMYNLTIVQPHATIESTTLEDMEDDVCLRSSPGQPLERIKWASVGINAENNVAKPASGHSSATVNSMTLRNHQQGLGGQQSWRLPWEAITRTPAAIITRTIFWRTKWDGHSYNSGQPDNSDSHSRGHPWATV